MDAVWQFEQSVERAINGGVHPPFLDSLFWASTCLGLGWVQAILVLPLFLRPITRILAAELLIGFAVSGLASQLVKHLVPRLRPSNFPTAVVAADEKIYHGSFPSGHTTTSFALATVLLLDWPGPRRRAVGIVAFALALLIGFSRIYRGVHWPSDALGGALLGISCGLIVHFIFQRAESNVR
jgi:undecaprenyl-diphosphatase